MTNGEFSPEKQNCTQSDLLRLFQVSPQKPPNKIQNNELFGHMQGCFHNQQENKSQSAGADSL